MIHMEWQCTNVPEYRMHDPYWRTHMTVDLDAPARAAARNARARANSKPRLPAGAAEGAIPVSVAGLRLPAALAVLLVGVAACTL